LVTPVPLQEKHQDTEHHTKMNTTLGKWKAGAACVVAGMMLAGGMAQAATLAHYNFTTTTYGDAATFTSADVAASSLGAASALSWNGAVNANSGGPTGNASPNENHTSSQPTLISTGTAAGNGVRVDHSNPTNWGINTTHYFSFTFKADVAGPGVFLEGFSLDFAHPSTGTTAAGHRGFVVQYSIDGGSFVEAGWGRLQGHSGSGNQAVNYGYNLGNVALLADKSVEFRIFKTNENGSGNEVRYDNIILTGSAIPEPGALAMGLLGGAFLFLRRRRVS